MRTLDGKIRIKYFFLGRTTIGGGAAFDLASCGGKGAPALVLALVVDWTTQVAAESVQKPGAKPDDKPKRNAGRHNHKAKRQPEVGAIPQGKSAQIAVKEVQNKIGARERG